MSYEGLNEAPTPCVVLVETGDLLINIRIIAKREYNNRIFKHDPRFRGDINAISKCNYYGATSHNASTSLDKLFSYYLPSLKDYNDYLNSLMENARIGPHSGILDVEEEFVEEAMDIAQKQNIRCEPSGIAGLALLLQIR